MQHAQRAHLTLISTAASAHTHKTRNTTQQVASRAERLGARVPASFRPSLQATCKAFLDGLHARCVTQLTHVLDAETWQVCVCVVCVCVCVCCVCVRVRARALCPRAFLLSSTHLPARP